MNRKILSASIILVLSILLIGMSSTYAVVDWESILTSNSSSPTYSSSSNNDKPTGDFEDIVIEQMVKEDNPGIGGSAGVGYMGTLIGENKTYIIKLYQADWNEIMSRTNGYPIGKTITVRLEHDDFEEKWDGDDFYYIDEYL